MTRLLATLSLLVAACSTFADVAPAKPAPTAQEILARVSANRLTKDFSFKARLFVGRDQAVSVEILVKNTADETRTIYRSGETHLLVVQPQRCAPRFYRRGHGELTEDQRLEKFLGSSFSYYDLALPQLRGPDAQLVGEERMRGQDCYVITSHTPGAPYARVKLWIHQDYDALLRAEAFDADDNLVRRFGVTSFKKVGDVWVPRGMEIAFVPKGQSLPAQEKSRLQIDEGNYDAQLPMELFQPERFGRDQAR